MELEDQAVHDPQEVQAAIDRATLQQTMSQAESAADALNSLIFPDADARIQHYFDRTSSDSDVGGRS